MRQTLSRTLNHSLIAVALACTLSACQITKVDADQQFTQVAQHIVDYRASINPYGKAEGVDGYLLENLSASFLEKKYQKNTEFLADLDAIDRDKLSEENRINLTILRGQVQNSVDEYVFNTHYMPLTSEYGFHSSLSFMISSSDYTKASDYELYLAKLQQIPRFFEQNIGWMRKGLEVGLTQPKAVLEGYQDSITAYIVDDATQSEFYKPFLKNTAGVSHSKFVNLQQQAKKMRTTTRI